MSGKIPGLLRVTWHPLQTILRGLNCRTASVTKMHRKTYERMYPTIVVLPDGSSINIKYHEPRHIIKLPLNLATLSEAERKLRLIARKPKTFIKIEEDIDDDDFDAKKYLKFVKK
ncbi:39S ribosomal protein L55, mitochondrial [Diprion similis]|uniref:39S ribosomal protein L55, mitochondrial n=1 Tax=Diprion similis TaxID=362088 RepID=UPI001EF94338|nr:39S ribosomal protein L55, mitochondrial [Diprion similis]